MLPFAPKTMQEHLPRYTKATETLYITEDIETGKQARPGETPENIFDFPDGLRLIISKDSMDGAPPVIHLSASVHKDKGYELTEQIVSGRISLESFLETVEDRFQELSGGIQLVFICFTPGKGIPHWRSKDPIN